MDNTLYRHDPADPKCWWCGSDADSREHKFKASELRAHFGSGAWRGENAVSHSADGQLRDVPSARSERLTWKRSMCRECNGMRSQPFDRAYDALLEFLGREGERVVAEARLRWNEVFPDRTLEHVGNVHAYWVKHVVCRLAEAQQAIPKALIGWLDTDRTEPPPQLWLDAVISQDWLRIERIEGGLAYSGFGNLQWNTGDGRANLWSHLTWRWFRLYYVIEYEFTRSATPLWQGEVALGSEDLGTDPGGASATHAT